MLRHPTPTRPMTPAEVNRLLGLRPVTTRVALAHGYAGERSVEERAERAENERALRAALPPPPA